MDSELKDRRRLSMGIAITLMIVGVITLIYNLHYLAESKDCDLNASAEDCICDEYEYSEEFVRKNGTALLCYNRESDLDWWCDEHHTIADCKKWTQLYDDVCKVCIKAHKVNKCDLDPTAEGCICDEYGEMVCDSLDDTSICDRTCLKSNGYCKDICIKAHEPNECEKENPEWTLDGRCSVQPTLNETNRNMECSTGWKEFCRKKTIYDYSCEELKWAMLKNQCYNPMRNRFYTGLACPNDRIINALEEKGCTI